VFLFPRKNLATHVWERVGPGDLLSLVVVFTDNGKQMIPVCPCAASPIGYVKTNFVICCDGISADVEAYLRSATACSLHVVEVDLKPVPGQPLRYRTTFLAPNSQQVLTEDANTLVNHLLCLLAFRFVLGVRVARAAIAADAGAAAPPPPNTAAGVAPTNNSTALPADGNGGGGGNTVVAPFPVTQTTTSVAPTGNDGASEPTNNTTALPADGTGGGGGSSVVSTSPDTQTATSVAPTGDAGASMLLNMFSQMSKEQKAQLLSQLTPQ
jgi:hypothetical protein